MILLSAVVLAGMSLFIGQEAATAENQALRLPANQWVVDWGETECTLVRRSGGNLPTTAFFRYELGREARHLIFMNAEWNAAPLPSGASVDIVLIPSGQRISGRGYGRGELAGERALVVNELDGPFLEAFPQSTGLRVERRGQTLAQIDYAAADRAFVALKECNDSLLRDWGVDPGVLDALSVRPTSRNSARGFTERDYPGRARQRGAEGVTVVRLDISERGSVDDCTVVKTSGHDDLDARTCDRLVTMPYEPALDAASEPLAVKIVQTVTWRLVQ